MFNKTKLTVGEKNLGALMCAKDALEWVFGTKIRRPGLTILQQDKTTMDYQVHVVGYIPSPSGAQYTLNAELTFTLALYEDGLYRFPKKMSIVINNPWVFDEKSTTGSSRAHLLLCLGINREYKLFPETNPALGKLRKLVSV